MFQDIEERVDFIYRRFDRLAFGDDPQFFHRAIQNVDRTLADAKGPHRDDIDHLYRLFEGLDQKTGGLLAHISVIIAVLAIFYNNVSYGWQVLLLIEMIAYVFLTFLCLRAIRMTTPRDDAGPVEAVDYVKLEYWKRRRYYNAANAFTIVATAFVVFSLVCHQFFS